MVCEALAAMEEFRVLPQAEREILFAAALLHDVAKPACTRVEAGRITSRGHSLRGAIDSRGILWELDGPFQAREMVCGLVRYHQVPFHLSGRSDAQRMAYRISQSGRCDLLAILAKADAAGRRSLTQTDLFLSIEMFREFCDGQACLNRPRQFPSHHSRFLYFRKEDRDPDYEAYDDARCEVILMSGLPGAGKDTWIAGHAAEIPQISLDEIREETGHRSTGDQGAVVQAAREQARVYLRAGQSFVWNATNLSAQIRTQCVDLFTAYHAKVRIIYVETDRPTLLQRNRSRESPVPAAAMARMLERWEVPDPWEADIVEWWINGVPLILPGAWTPGPPVQPDAPEPASRPAPPSPERSPPR
jgi:predicted kinase